MNFNEYQDESRKTWIGGEKGFIRSILGLIGESGEIAEKVKKLFREDRQKIDGQKERDTIAKELGDVMYYVARIADYYQLSLKDIAKLNIEKLKSRKERSKIKGSGDNR